MDIEFEFSGGYANVNLAYHGDTDKLPPEIASKLLRLIESSGVLELQQSEIASTNTGPTDEFYYKLMLYDGNKKKSFSFNDVTAPKELRPLLDFLQELAWEQARQNR